MKSCACVFVSCKSIIVRLLILAGPFRVCPSHHIWQCAWRTLLQPRFQGKKLCRRQAGASWNNSQPFLLAGASCLQYFYTVYARYPLAVSTQLSAHNRREGESSRETKQHQDDKAR